MKNNKYLSYALGILFSFCLIVTLLITSVEAVTYWTPGYYEREYSKYNVTEDVHMEMDDLLDVTTEMMAYLRGNREDLHVPTIVDGQPREFFNDREIAHMEDVRGLFVGALVLRRICIITAFVCVALLWLLKGRYRPGSSTVCLLGNRTVFCHDLCAGTCDIHRLHEIFRDLPPHFLQQ